MEMYPNSFNIDQQEKEDNSMEVVVSWPGVGKEVCVIDADCEDAEELGPEHLFLKGETGHQCFLHVKNN